MVIWQIVACITGTWLGFLGAKAPRETCSLSSRLKRGMKKQASSINYSCQATRGQLIDTGRTCLPNTHKRARFAGRLSKFKVGYNIFCYTLLPWKRKRSPVVISLWRSTPTAHSSLESIYSFFEYLQQTQMLFYKNDSKNTVPKCSTLSRMSKS